MTPGQQRYHVAQIFAECRETGLPLPLAIWAVIAWFDKQRISPPASILDWLDEVPADQWRRDTMH